MTKKKNAIKRPKNYKYEGSDRRKKARQVHIIDEDSSDRDFDLAKSDLNNFFLDILDKHHNEW